MKIVSNDVKNVESTSKLTGIVDIHAKNCNGSFFSATPGRVTYLTQTEQQAMHLHLT